MKKLYPLVTLLLGTLITTTTTQAQTYANGTYTAVRDGNWHVTSGPNVWDINGEPPAACSNCKIVINSTVHLNLSVTLTNSALLSIDGGKLIVDGSTGTDWGTSFNVIAFNDGSNPVNAIKTLNGGTVDATAANREFDGLWTTFNTTPTTYNKQVGNGVSAYVGTTVSNNRDFTGGNTMGSGGTLTANGTLPITLADFEVIVSNGEVNLTWKTLQESNADHFDIERSANAGAKWEVIGSVAAKGNSATVTDYSFTDDNAGSGTFYYRVHGYTRDRQPFLTQIKAISTHPIANISIYPNPAKEYVNVSVPASQTGALRIRLIGQSGAMLVDKNLTGAAGTIQTFSVSNYAPGNYLIQVIAADGTKQVNKLVIARN